MRSAGVPGAIAEKGPRTAPGLSGEVLDPPAAPATQGANRPILSPSDRDPIGSAVVVRAERDYRSGFFLCEHMHPAIAHESCGVIVHAPIRLHWFAPDRLPTPLLEVEIGSKDRRGPPRLWRAASRREEARCPCVSVLPTPEA